MNFSDKKRIKNQEERIHFTKKEMKNKMRNSKIESTKKNMFYLKKKIMCHFQILI